MNTNTCHTLDIYAKFWKPCVIFLTIHNYSLTYHWTHHLKALQVATQSETLRVRIYFPWSDEQQKLTKLYYLEALLNKWHELLAAVIQRSYLKAWNIHSYELHLQLCRHIFLLFEVSYWPHTDLAARTTSPQFRTSARYSVLFGSPLMLNLSTSVYLTQPWWDHEDSESSCFDYDNSWVLASAKGQLHYHTSVFHFTSPWFIIHTGYSEKV